MNFADQAALWAMRLLGAKSRWLDGDGGRVHVLDIPGTGKAPPVLLVHGLGSCAADYLPMIRAMRGVARNVVAVDLPGHGQSPPPTAGMHPQHLRSVLASVLDRLVPEPHVVFGNSLGGAVALRLAAGWPDRVCGVMVASPAGAPMQEADLREFLAGFRFPTRGHALAFVDRFLARRRWIRSALAFGVRYRMRREPIQALLDAIGPGDLLSEDELRRVTAPVHVFWGAGDGVLPPANAAWFRAHLPANAVVEVVEGFGHAPYVDDAGDFNRRVVDFVRACR